MKNVFEARINGAVQRAAQAEGTDAGPNFRHIIPQFERSASIAAPSVPAPKMQHTLPTSPVAPLYEERVNVMKVCAWAVLYFSLRCSIFSHVRPNSLLQNLFLMSNITPLCLLRLHPIRLTDSPRKGTPAHASLPQTPVVPLAPQPRLIRHWRGRERLFCLNHSHR